MRVRVDPRTSRCDAGRQDLIGFDGFAEMAACRRGRAEPGQSAAQSQEETGVHRCERAPSGLPCLDSCGVDGQCFGKLSCVNAADCRASLSTYPDTTPIAREP